MSLLERIKGLFINKNIQKEHNNNLEGNSEYYDIYHENEEIQILGEISKLASEIKTAFFAIQPDEQDILEYTKALEKIQLEVNNRGLHYEANTDRIFSTFINELQRMYESEKKEPVDYNKLKKELNDDLELEWATGDEEKIWRHFCQFDYNDIMNPTKLELSIKKKLDECYEMLGEECLDKDFGELTTMRNEFAGLFANVRKIIDDYSKTISEMIIRSNYEVNDEALKKYYEFLTIQPQLQQMQTNIYEVINFISQNITEKRLEKYTKDDIFMKELQVIMGHNQDKHKYLFHGTQALEDSTKILENGLLMMRKDLSSTTAEEITQEELLLYERRRYDGEHWNRICHNSRPACNRW